jgi:hypothetical protein
MAASMAELSSSTISTSRTLPIIIALPMPRPAADQGDWESSAPRAGFLAEGIFVAIGRAQPESE